MVVAPAGPGFPLIPFVKTRIGTAEGKLDEVSCGVVVPVRRRRDGAAEVDLQRGRRRDRPPEADVTPSTLVTESASSPGQCRGEFGGKNGQRGHAQTHHQHPQLRGGGQGEAHSRDQSQVGSQARRAFGHHHEERARDRPFGGVAEPAERRRRSSFNPRGWLAAAAARVHTRVSADPQPHAVDDEVASVSGQ